jgi:5'-methylthioadenosine phosphorylase
MPTTKLGVIGGSGLYHLPELRDVETVAIETPYGPPSDPPRAGRIGDAEVVFLSRHGAGHPRSPTDVPYRANVYALKQLGVTHVVSISAVGSLREELPPRSIVVPDQIIDRTVARPQTFFDDGVVAHVGIADPFCPHLRRALLEAIAASGRAAEDGGTHVCIEGPQFSTRAESNLYRTWDAAIIGMTSMPEARLAREAELCYAIVAHVTDYDVWHDSEAEVSVELVRTHLQANVGASRDLLVRLATAGLPERSCACGDALANAIMTAPELIPDPVRRRLGVIGARYLDP